MAITIAKLSTVSTLDSSKFSAARENAHGHRRSPAISFGAFSRVGGMITNFAGRAIRALPSMVLHSLAAGDASRNSPRNSDSARRPLRIFSV